MRKKFVRSAIMLGMSVVLSMSTFAMSFSDVANNHWAYESIVYMQENRLMVSSSSGEFRPNELMSVFDVVEMIAKATGYIDEQVNPNMDEALKQEIRQMYNENIGIVQQWDSRYDAWNTSSNEQITYLLGKGYLKQEELSSFLALNSQGNAVKANIKKEDLAVYLVRVLGEEQTAIDQYVPGRFTDEDKIAESKRPHVAYLNSIGLINGDATGAFGAGQELTRAIVAKMSADVFQLMEENGEVPSEDLKQGTVSRILSKDDGDYFVGITNEAGGQQYYTAAGSEMITLENGSQSSISNLKEGDEISFVIERRNNVEYMSQIKIASGDSNSGGSQTQQVISGVIENFGRVGDITVATNSGSVTYVLADNVDVRYNGNVVGAAELSEGDNVTMYITDHEIVRVIINEKVQEETQAEVELISMVETRDDYVFEVLDGNVVKEVVVDKNISISRNGETVQFVDLKVGDEIVFMSQNGNIIGLMATSVESTVQGTVQSITIGQNSSVTVLADGELVEVVIAPSSSLYDTTTRKEISIRDLLLYSTVEIDLDSKEVKSLDVTKAPSSITYKGVIQYVGDGARYIDVLVEYDRLTDASMVVKRINVPGETRIIEDGRDKYRGILEEGMEVLITYRDGEVLVPTTIEIL